MEPINKEKLADSMLITGLESERDSLRVDNERLEKKLKSHEKLNAIIGGLIITLVLVGVVMAKLLWEKGSSESTELQVAKAKLEECHQAGQQPAEILDAVAKERLCNYQDRFEETLGLLDQCRASRKMQCAESQEQELATCLESLKTRLVPTCPGVLTEQFQQVADNCAAQLAPIQSRWDAKFRLAQEAIDAAKAAGVGPTLRNWIADSDAQMKAREVLLTMQDWHAVDQERADVGEECVGRMVTIVRDLEQTKAYMALYNYPQRDQHLAKQVERLFPDWMRYRQMELDLTREAVGCKD